MYSESDLEAAVAGGVLSPDQAEGFRNFVAAGHHAPAVDEEHFRLLTGFNDIFVAIAAAILLLAVGWIGHYLPPHVGTHGPSPFSGLFVAATAWGLAEYFTRQRRMALPSILLLMAFAGGVCAATIFGTVALIGPDYFNHSNQASALVFALGAAVSSVATWFHWRRFHVPITVAVGAAAVVAVVLGLVASAFVQPQMSEAQGETVRQAVLATALVLGLATFFLAMRWDASDPRRETRRSDVAFWLHLLAAPLIVHPVFALLGLNHGEVGTPGAVIVVLLYVTIGLVALAIDRRALLVSALAYVLYALNSLFQTYGVVELNFALTALVIGSSLLLLSAFWASARRAVVAPLPLGLRGKLPVIDRSVRVAATA